MPNVATDYHETLSEIEGILKTEEVGLRILIDRDGLDKLNSDPETNQLIKFSVVCLHTSSETHMIKNDINFETSFLFLDHTLEKRDLIKYIEETWQTPTPHELLYLTMNSEEFNYLNRENTPKITLLPFPLKTPLPNEIERFNKLHKFYEKGDDPKTGITYVKIINRIFNKKITLTKGTRPVISFFGYKYESPFNFHDRFYRPRNFVELSEKLQEKSKMIITGYGMGNDHTAVKVLQYLSQTRPNKKIFEIRIYAREELNKFIEDYEAGNLGCSSVILRDFFDPFIKAFSSKGEFVIAENDFIKRIKELSKAANNNFVDANCIPSPEIRKRMSSDRAFEKLFRQQQIFDSFDGTSGNYLIITSQFDAEQPIIKFYNAHLKELEFANTILTKLQDFHITAINYGHKNTTHKLFLEEFLAEVEYKVNYSLEEESRNKIKQSFSEFISYWNKKSENEPFRIGMAILFKKILFRRLTSFMENKAFVNEAKRDFVDDFVQEMVSTKNDCNYYYQFLH